MSSSLWDKIFHRRMSEPPQRLLEAVYKNNGEALRQILATETFGPETLYIALEQAVHSNFPQMAEQLVTQADASRYDSALLAHACLHNNSQLVQLLLPHSNPDDAFKVLDAAKYRSGRVARAKQLLAQYTPPSTPSKLLLK